MSFRTIYAVIFEYDDQEMFNVDRLYETMEAAKARAKELNNDLGYPGYTVGTRRLYK